MAWLTLGQLKALRITEAWECMRCGMAVVKTYCRECDEFFVTGHGHLCFTDEALEGRKHEQHRHY
jgi:hypothetical protein